VRVQGSERYAVPEVDPQRPSSARIYDYLLGGAHNFAADREAAAAITAVMPDVPGVMRVNRDFMLRVVGAAAAAGLTQFLDLGAGIPAEGPNVLEVARRADPLARVVHVDLDPVAVVHGHRLLADDPRADFLYADLTDADAVLEAPAVRELIDFDRPVGLLVVSVAHFIPDTERLGRALEKYREVCAPGSWLALSHMGAEGEPQQAELVRRVYNNTTSPLVLRDRDDVRALFGEWPLIEPGLTTGGRWRPDPGERPAGEVADSSVLVAVARKGS
jgi:hypothetical protein